MWNCINKTLAKAYAFKVQAHPMNPSWMTGKVSRDRLEHEYPKAEIEGVEVN
jgi:hypothetical protein